MLARGRRVEHDSFMSPSMRKFLAELVGTFVLVVGGVGSAVIASNAQFTGGVAPIGIVGVSFAFGLSLLAMAYAIGPISGCHVNPAVSAGLALLRRISWKDAGAYMVAQVLGAIAGAGLILLIAKGQKAGYDVAAGGLGANGFDAASPLGYTMLAAFVTEAIMTFILVMVVLATTSKRAPGGFAGIPIGLTLVLIHLVSIPVTNTSVNPARSIGPALFVGGDAIGQLWLFIIAPLVGAAIAAGVYALIAGWDDVEANRHDLKAPAVDDVA